MPDDLPRFYWDADVLLSYVNGIPDRLPDIDAFLERSGKDLQLITSSVTIVEVAFGKAEQDAGALDLTIEAKIDQLWQANSPIRLVDFHAGIGAEARQLMRQALLRGWALKPMDAIHLSTARQQAVAEFHSYDTELTKYADLVGFRIGPPLSPAPKLPL
jgi:predicted nucleic acid-binding protein